MNYDSEKDGEYLTFSAFLDYFDENDKQSYEDLQQSYLDSLSVDIVAHQPQHVEELSKFEKLLDNDLPYLPMGVRCVDLSGVVAKLKQWLEHLKLMFLNR